MQRTTNRTVAVGVFDDPRRAQQAIEDLKRSGFSEDQISVAARGEKGFAESHAGTGAAGNLAGPLIGLGIPKDEAKYVDEEFQRGRIIVTARADGRYDEARDFLHRNGAHEARTRGEERSMELREERLHGRPEQARAGEVDVRKEVVTERQSVDVPVEREEVIIERRPSSGRPSSGRPVGEHEEIRVPVREEHARVEKDTVSRGEVNVKKQTRHDTERVSGDVKKERAKVEKRGDANVRERR